MAALADFFREQKLVYAQDDLPGEQDPVDEFLFDKKRGYCEFFASSYVTLARLLGIPARLVGGYLGGDYNKLGGYYLVTEDMAHVWVEVLTDSNRWVRIDPSRWADNAEAVLLSRQAAQLGTWQRLTDAFNYYWIQAVVIYDFGRQLKVLQGAQEQLRGLRAGKVPTSLWGWLALLALSGGGWWWHRTRLRLSTEARLVEELRRRLSRRYGMEAAAEQFGLTELADRLRCRPCHEFARIYQAAVFRDRRLTRQEVARLKTLLREI
jgi:hypothetical protein